MVNTDSTNKQNNMRFEILNMNTIFCLYNWKYALGCTLPIATKACKTTVSTVAWSVYTDICIYTYACTVMGLICVGGGIGVTYSSISVMQLHGMNNRNCCFHSHRWLSLVHIYQKWYVRSSRVLCFVKDPVGQFNSMLWILFNVFVFHNIPQSILCTGPSGLIRRSVCAYWLHVTEVKGSNPSFATYMILDSSTPCLLSWVPSKL